MNCKIHPVLYRFYLRLRAKLGADIVHRRKRASDTSIELIFYSDDQFVLTGKLNTLREAEKWGFWVICRRQTKQGYTTYKDHQVYQLFLSPVHPKKRRERQTHITALPSSSQAMTA